MDILSVINKGIKIASFISAVILLLKTFLKDDLEKKIEPYYMQFFRKTIREFIIMIISLLNLFQFPYLNNSIIISSSFILIIGAVSIILGVIIAIHDVRIFNMKDNFFKKIKQKIIKFQNKSIKPVKVIYIFLIVFFAILCNNWLINELNGIIKEDNKWIEEVKKQPEYKNEKLEKNSLISNTMEFFLMSYKEIRAEKSEMIRIKGNYVFIYIIYYIFFRIAIGPVFKSSFPVPKCYLHFKLKNGRELNNTILKSRNKEAYIVFSEDSKKGIVVYISEISEIEICYTKKERLELSPT
ncbi:MAG: hypothetical protein FH753_02520 [Firmicutes bacterium]|nr:hypothetical protein [Bacillota bacterium]